ncbi:hypothetical protein CPB83DRAFT_908542 [Crepidotus variabilis]|uniref:Uncharacterized protein n=1 Tax=Crepidotus variabilis TaxID=179855 RepID=A0A9P6EC59_9AGAR|nr:hypothetical protein CPB83DRAFT_908542 [Crepidotus variabilis]
MDASPARPPLNHAGTTLQECCCQAQGEEIDANGPKHLEGDVESDNHSTQAMTTNSPNDAETLAKKTTMETSSSTTLHNIVVLAGIEMNPRAAKAVTDHPQATSYFVTLVGNIISLLVNFLFSTAIIRFAQEWVAKREYGKEQITVFHVSLLSAFRNRNWPWKVTELQHLVVQQRWLPVALVGACIAAFAFVPSGMTSLLNPVPFNRTIELKGSELDFSSNAPDCLQWFETNPISNQCDWKTFNGLEYTTCLGENQLVDVLESGRGNILSLVTNNTEGLVFTQLGPEDGLLFLGPIRGVLPMGPKGVPAFNTVQPSPALPERPYNYTLEHQGLIGNSAFWACKTFSNQGQEALYSIYLRGGGFFKDAIRNITCTVSPTQPAQFQVTYRSKAQIFSTEQHKELSPARFANSLVIEKAVAAVGAAVNELQNFQTNLLAESVITFGVKSFKLQPYNKTDEDLRLYAAMIQGILEYQVTYKRLICSTFPNRPESCTRTVNGTFSYETIGWEVTRENIGFLLPMTIVNIASLAVILIAICIAKPGVRQYDIDPTDPNSLIMARYDLAKTIEPNEWRDSVTYQPRTLFKRTTSQALTPDPEKLAEGVISILE